MTSYVEGLTASEYYWADLARRDIQVMVASQPCLPSLAGIPVYLYISKNVNPEELNDFLIVDQTEFNQKKDTNLHFRYDFPTAVSMPYCTAT